MGLYRRPDSPYWWVKISRGRGKKAVSRSSGTADRKKVKEYEARLAASLWEQDRLGVKPTRSWDEAVVRFVEETKASKASHQTDVVHLRWLHQHLDGATLDEITVERLRDLQCVRMAYKGKTKAKPTAATVNRCMQVVRRVLRKACDEWNWLDKVPKVPFLAEPTRRVFFLNEVEISTLLREAPDHMRPLVELAIETGLRMSELLGLQWSQIDLVERKAWLHADQTKARRARPVPLSDKAVDIVRSVLGVHQSHLFTYRGNPILRINGRAWRAVVARAGVPECRWHDLRHTWASRLIMSGASLQELQELGGWESSEMVRRYAHFGGRHLAQVQERASRSNALMVAA